MSMFNKGNMPKILENRSILYNIININIFIFIILYKIEELPYFCLFCHLFGTLVLTAGHPAVFLSSGPVRVGIVLLLTFEYILNIYAVFCKRFMNGHFNSEMIPFSYLKRFSPEVFLCKGFRILIFWSFLHLEGCLYSL